MNGQVVNGQRRDGKRKGPVRVALEAAFVIWLSSFLTVMIAALPGLPTLAQIYAGLIIAGSFGTGAYAAARGIDTGRGNA